MKRLKKMASKYNNMKYDVVAGGGIGEYQDSNSTNSPEEAIKIWCNMQKLSPMDVSIIAKSSDSIELLNWAKANKEKIEEMMTSTGTDKIYKVDYLINRALDGASGVKESYDEYGGDQVYPFCAG